MSMILKESNFLLNYLLNLVTYTVTGTGTGIISTARVPLVCARLELKIATFPPALPTVLFAVQTPP